MLRPLTKTRLLSTLRKTRRRPGLKQLKMARRALHNKARLEHNLPTSSRWQRAFRKKRRIRNKAKPTKIPKHKHLHQRIPIRNGQMMALKMVKAPVIRKPMVDRLMSINLCNSLPLPISLKEHCEVILQTRLLQMCPIWRSWLQIMQPERTPSNMLDPTLPKMVQAIQKMVHLTNLPQGIPR